MNKCLSLFIVLVISVLIYFSGNSFFVKGAINLFEGVEVLVDLNDEKLIKISNKNVDSFIKFLDLQNYNKFILEDRVIIEGYSNKLKDYIVSNNNKINVQISISEDCSLVGYPLIKNSF